jgi:adenine-specific DNA-methyltransferase
MPVLEWIGKDKVINHDKDVPFKVLERQYSFDEKGQHKADNGSKNMIIHGDNLFALKALLPKYENKIQCIYIDPPYNTGNEGWVYNDNVNDPKMLKWLGEVVGKEGEDLTRHDKWLCMMYPRLKLMKRLLADDGVFLVSIGDDELASLLLVIKEIFGNVKGIFVWKSRSKPTNAGDAKYRVQKVSEYVVMYTKNDKKLFNIGQQADPYSYPYEDELGHYRTSTILTSNFGTYQRETMRFEIGGYTPPADKRWKAGVTTIQGLFDNHRLLFTDDGSPMEKIYDYDGGDINMPLYTLIDPKLSGTAENGKTLLNKIIGSGHGFDTVKPLELINYLLKTFSNEGDIVLDAFAGTATTAHAVLYLNRISKEQRYFVLIELGDYAESVTATRVKKVIQGYEFEDEIKEVLYDKKITTSDLRNGNELLMEAEKVINDVTKSYDKVSVPKVINGNLKVIGIKNLLKSKKGTGGNFSYYELGDNLFLEDGNLNLGVGIKRIREYIWFTETGQNLVDVKETGYLLGKNNDFAYYFYYDKHKPTTLDYSFLKNIKEKAEGYVIYADSCILSDKELIKYNITFKKIPRDINKL